jgi:hypothetical protein
MVYINCAGDQLPPNGNPINRIIYLLREYSFSSSGYSYRS